MSSKNNKQQMLQAAVAVNTALNAADCFGFLPVRGTKLNISGNAKVGCLETDEILIADNQKKALVIKEGDNSYMTISTEDSAEKVNIHENTKMDKNLEITGTLNAGASTLASASITGALSATSVSATSVSATTVTATGAVSGASGNFATMRIGGLPEKNLYELFASLQESTALGGAAASFAHAPTAAPYKQQIGDIEDMHNFLQANVDTLTTAQLSALGIRKDTGVDTTFTAGNATAIDTATGAYANAGVAGTTTVISGKVGVSTGTGGDCNVLWPAQTGQDGASLIVFKDVELALANSRLIIESQNGYETSANGRSIVLRNAAGTYSVNTNTNDANTDDDLRITGTGSKFSGFLYLYENTNAKKIVKGAIFASAGTPAADFVA